MTNVKEVDPLEQNIIIKGNLIHPLHLLLLPHLPLQIIPERNPRRLKILT